MEVREAGGEKAAPVDLRVSQEWGKEVGSRVYISEELPLQSELPCSVVSTQGQPCLPQKIAYEERPCERGEAGIPEVGEGEHRERRKKAHETDETKMRIGATDARRSR